MSGERRLNLRIIGEAMKFRILAIVVAVIALSACLPDGPEKIQADSGRTEIGYLPLKPARAGTALAPHLRRCVYEPIYIPRDDCTLEQLPLIGMRTPDVSVANVMEHVLVEREWMARRFQHVLESLPPELLPLFRSVTAIVIASDIRPSFYLRRTAAIYIDPAHLWLSEEEFNQTPQYPDYRSNFGDELQFRTLWRYVKDGGYAYRSGRSYFPGRTLEEVVRSMAALLAHELAHAADFIPPLIAAQAHPWQTPAELAYDSARIYETCWFSLSGGGGCSAYRLQPLSFDLDAAYGLSSYPFRAYPLRPLAEVRYRGKAASEELKSFMPDDIGMAFRESGANDHYNYSSYAEDVAMLFEELMMSHFFGVQRDFAVTDNPPGDDLTAADYTVFWGQRGRISDPLVIERALFVAGSVLPELDLGEVRAGLPQPVEMVGGANWLENLALQSSGVLVPLQGKLESEAIDRGIGQDIQPPHGH